MPVSAADEAAVLDSKLLLSPLQPLLCYDPFPNVHAFRVALRLELTEIAAILDTSFIVCLLLILLKGLDRETIAVIKALCEEGVNPQALAQVIRFLRREGSAKGSP
ncbi:mitotic-spindle organizing protein [Gracilaria domingensis]|nr:mitotic-spindle organizing protein [Gracilaria domingensis]